MAGLSSRAGRPALAPISSPRSRGRGPIELECHMRVLLVEDDPMLSEGLMHALRGHGYAADHAADGAEAAAAARSQTYAVIVLDLGLPGGMGGLEVLQEIRNRGDTTPVIILTANGRQEDKVRGLDAGANDYVAKPFDLGELLARVRAQIRGHEGRPSDTLFSGKVRLDLTGRAVQRDERPVAVTAKEFRILVELMRRKGQFVTKTELEAALYDGEAGVESNTIEVTVYALRRKLGNDLILTARGLGYMAPAQ
jgi:DNA-binding response OmpR family regulator